MLVGVLDPGATNLSLDADRIGEVHLLHFYRVNANSRTRTVFQLLPAGSPRSFVHRRFGSCPTHDLVGRLPASD